MRSWCHGDRPEPKLPLGRAGWNICGAQGRDGRGHTARGRGFESRRSSPASGRADAGGRASGLCREEAPRQGRPGTEGTHEVGLSRRNRAAAGDEGGNKTGCRAPSSDCPQATGDPDGERHSRDLRGGCQTLVEASRVRDADPSGGPALERRDHPRQPPGPRDCGPRSHHDHDREGRPGSDPSRASRGMVARRREGTLAGRVGLLPLPVADRLSWRGGPERRKLPAASLVCKQPAVGAVRKRDRGCFSRLRRCSGSTDTRQAARTLTTSSRPC